MKTSKAKLLWLALPLCCIAACNTGLDTYSGVPGIYFAVRVESNAANADTMYRDSTILPFIVTESTDSTLDIRMKIMGAVSDKDRLFRIETVAEGTDIHPEDCDPVDGEYVLKAGEVFGSLPLTFHRTPNLEGEERRLKIRLVPNEDFSLPVTTWRNSSTEYVSVVEHTVIVSDKYVQLPGYRESYFGPFSEKKMKLILELFDMKLSDFNEELNYTYAKALGQQFDRYLKTEKAAGRTVYEEDGTEMVAGDYIYN